MEEYKIGDISSFLNSASTPLTAAANNDLFTSKPQPTVTVEEIYAKPQANPTPAAAPGKRPKKRKTAAPAKSAPEEPVFPRLSPEEQLMVDKRTIFIGNLPIGYKRKKLRKMFDEFGKIESLRFRSVAISDLKLGRKVCLKSNKINENATSKNGYIVFVNEECVENSLSKNGTLINEHHIRVDKLVKSKIEVDDDCKNSVFIGNIPFAATEEDMRTALDQCGDIEYVRLLREPKTNIGKGFGYVKFVDSSSVMLAMKVKDTVEISGRKLRIQRCKSKNALESKKKAKEWKDKKEADKNAAFRGRKSKDSDKEMFAEKKKKFRNKKVNPDSRPKVKKPKALSDKTYDKKVNKKSKKRDSAGSNINKKKLKGQQ